MNNPATILRTNDLGRLADDGRWLLKGISLDVVAGERLGVTGPTGSGKTLLLRAMALLDPIDAGSILWNGNEIANDVVPEYRRQVIYLHQQPMLLEGTVESNLRRPFQFRGNRGLHFDRVRILDWLKLLGRDEMFLTRNCDDLSGGESQIVALLRAIQLEPDVLLLDEPTVALDTDSVAAIEKLVGHWLNERDHRRTTIWVSHDIDQIERMADKQIRLKEGRIEG